MPVADPDTTAVFITRWVGSTVSELSTAQSFIIERCAPLGRPRPRPTPQQVEINTTQPKAEVDDSANLAAASPAAPVLRRLWPADLPARMRAVADLLATTPAA